jgi:hypothetical protein
MRKLLTAAALLISAVTLHAQQNVVMIQVLDGYTGVAIARHAVSISLGATAADAQARSKPIHTYTDERGILLLPLPQGAPGWIQLWTGDMHPCEPHPEASSYSLAKAATTGVQTPNACSKLAVHPGPGHFVTYMREFTAAEHAALKH